MDGLCFGNLQEDDCGICGGDNSSCNAPIAESLSYSMNEDNTLSITLSGSDPNNNPITFIIIDEPNFGQISGDSPNLIYTPNENFFGQDSFTYQSFNGLYYSDISTVLIDIEPENDAPIANSLDIILSNFAMIITY